MQTVRAFSTTPSLATKPKLGGGNIGSRSITTSSSSSSTAIRAAATTEQPRLRRELGSQENLMLPRQYGVNPGVVFPSMNHVSCAVLSGSANGSAIPSAQALKHAVSKTMEAHPLLRARIEGSGEPDERIDLFRMVRKGDNHPCTFVADIDSSNDDNNSNDCTSYEACDVLKLINVGGGASELEASWRAAFLSDLDDGSTWCNVEANTTPLWKLEFHRSESDAAGAALLLSFNHAISDQTSASKLTDQILALAADYDETNGVAVVPSDDDDDDGALRLAPAKQSIPPSVEESVLGRNNRFKDVQTKGFGPNTVAYVAGKALEETKGPVILPDDFDFRTDGNNPLAAALTTISGNAAGGDDAASNERTSVLAFRSLSKDGTARLLEACRANGVTVTNALSAALTLVSTEFVSGGGDTNNIHSNKQRNYKILQSLDMRRYGAKLDKGESVGCLAGSMDLMHGPLPDGSAGPLISGQNGAATDFFWNLAKEGRDQTQKFVDSDGPVHAVRVFDFAMTISDLNNLVHLTAQSKDSQGRAYSAGFTNAGVYERLDAFGYENDKGEKEKTSTQHGNYKIDDIYYAASNARSGSLYRFSCITVNDEMKFTFHPASPIVSEETNQKFADALLDVLKVVGGSDEALSVSSTTASTSTTADGGDSSGGDGDGKLLGILPKNSLVLAVAAIGTVAVLSHAGAYADFYSSLMEMKANIEDPADFSAALNFWIFFAVGHPILQPILWISDVLHGSPGPMIGDLVPVTFLLGNIVAIAAISYVSEIRNAVNVGALFAFLAYVGAGLDGQAGMGDFNLAIDDSYKGQIVKGCPTYEQVRQPSMDDFDLEKYQGLWYEQKFHDWTQFKEVYDTTLGIKLTDGGNGWIDDFAVKGPAPDSAPLSWDKSPVGNGAHYFLFGRVDPSDPKGILREKGFGVEFPNYIVDVKKDAETGEYKEAIQFQCLERGGVRVFEGINFMSRNPTMTEDELGAMHKRAEEAGMYPYGASPEQMHRVARRPIDAPPLDNSWQAMWRFIGVDKLLELLTQSIEDGGR